MAALKDRSPPHSLPDGTAARGRDGYSLLGVLRTKPGRADSPRTSCMSCSDKIAVWTVCGIQGALGALFFEPVYLDAIIIGDVDGDVQTSVFDDCRRAFHGRIGTVVAEPPYGVHEPTVYFSNTPFEHSRSARGSQASSAHECAYLANRRQNCAHILYSLVLDSG